MLQLGALRTFNVIWELQQLMSALAHSQVKEPKVVDPHHKWISITGEVLHLESLQRGMQHLIEKYKRCTFLSVVWTASWLAPTTLAWAANSVSHKCNANQVT